MDLKGYDVALLQEDYPFICHMALSQAKKYGIKTILSSERTYYPDSFKKNILMFLDKTSNKKLRESADVITTHCSSAKLFLKNELSVERDIKVIHVGVDVNLFKPMLPVKKHLTEDKTCIKILTVARLHKYKGLEYLIQAMCSLKENLPEVKLYIMGNGVEDQNLKNLVKSLGLADKIVFLQQPIPNNEMLLLYNECDIYVQPSIIEPFGIAVLEAMACGKPVIGTRIGGMLDTIKDGETGFLIEPRSAKDIAEKIILLKDAHIRKEMGIKARNRTVEVFDWARIGSVYDKLIRDICQKDS
jgi:glycosyltransferase involved in cell wall biosynthesis